MKLENPQLLRFAVAVVGAVGIALFLYLAKDGNEVLLPADLGEIKLTQHLSGKKAQGMIDHLHGKGVTPQENFIGFYEGNGARATLYVSVYADVTKAKDADRRMAQLIQAGNPAFGSYEQRNIGSQTVSRCLGMGQIHYFFSRSNRLYWLSVDPPTAQRAAESLVHMAGR